MEPGGKIQGTTDIPLNETGRQQAEQLAAVLKKGGYPAGTRIDAVYTSPLARAFQTAEILAKEGKLPLRRLTGLRERDFGCWEGKSWQQVEAEYPDEFHLWREQPMVGIPSGGESRKSCEARSERAIRQILEETAGDAVIVAHGGILVFLMNYLLRFHREPQEIIVANASLSVVSYDRSTGMGKLLALNETGTLEQQPIRCVNKKY
ncbi:MAG: histidine phosphatase family protein [Clostridium fessum]